MKLDIKNPNILTNIKKPNLETVKAVGKTALSIVGRGVVVGVTILGLAAVQDSSTSSSPSRSPAIQQKVPKSREPDQAQNALDRVVTNLENGGHVEVSANNIYLPGVIGTAIGRPLVLSADGQNYFAYAQGQPPNFNQKQPADVISNMAIVNEPASNLSNPLEEAHLNKKGILVNANQTAVGFAVNSANNK